MSLSRLSHAPGALAVNRRQSIMQHGGHEWQDGSTTILQQDAWSCLHQCWAPHEFVNLGGSNNITAPPASLPPLTVPTTATLKPSESAIHETDFETLHHFFSPTPIKALEEPDAVPSDPETTLFRGDCLSKPHTKITCINEKKGDTNDHHLTMTKVVGKVDVFSLTAAKRASDALCNAVQCENTFTLCTTTGPHRKVVVERAQTHFFILFDAMHAVFPELGCPTVKKPAEICDLHVDGLLELVSTHSRKVCTFLPLLYFLFETKLRQFALYFSRLPDQLEARIKEEQQPFDQTTKTRKVLGWMGNKLGMGSSNNSGGGAGGGANGGEEQGGSPLDVLRRFGDLSSAPDLIADHTMALPDRFIVHFSNMQENHKNTQLATTAATALYCNLTEETDALLDVVESIGSFEDVFFAPPPCFAGENLDGQMLSGEFDDCGSEDGGSSSVTGGGAASTASNPLHSGGGSKVQNTSNLLQRQHTNVTHSGEVLQQRCMNVHNLLHNAVTHQQYGAIPIVKTMVVSMHMTNYNSQNARAHSLRPLLELKTLPERENRLLAENQKSSKDSNMIATMTNVVVAQRDRLANYKSCFLGEVERLRSKRVDALRSVCIYVSMMTMQLAQCYWQDETLKEPVHEDPDFVNEYRWFNLAFDPVEEEASSGGPVGSVGKDGNINFGGGGGGGTSGGGGDSSSSSKRMTIKNGVLQRMPEEYWPTSLPRDEKTGEIVPGEASSPRGEVRPADKPRSASWYSAPTQTVGDH